MNGWTVHIINYLRNAEKKPYFRHIGVFNSWYIRDKGLIQNIINNYNQNLKVGKIIIYEKHTINTIISSLLSFVKGQTIKRVKDKHIVGQEKRQVFYQWGDWQPEPKYFLGIQTNYAYAMVWGWLAPSRNRDYKGGNDIRPLGLAGLQNQRYATTLYSRTKQAIFRKKQRQHMKKT
jgi:hypothetical protein